MPPRLALRNSADFQRVFARGRRARRDGVTVFALPRSDREAPSRLGLAVGASPAVQRNRIRRRLRVAVWSCLPERGVDLAIRGGAELFSTPYARLRSDVGAAVAAALEGGWE